MAEIKFISILIPTLNEIKNIREVLGRTIEVLDSSRTTYEIIVIDDSSCDDTVKAAEVLLNAKRKGMVIQKTSKPVSLSSSIVYGIKQAKGEFVVIMDADGSHPPELILNFIEAINSGYDLVVASRYVKGGGFADEFPAGRKIMSIIGCMVGRLLTDIRDNTSGFFCIRKSALEGMPLKPRGFKIGLEIFVKASYRSYKEIPYIFINRKKGKSKLSLKTLIDYFQQVISLASYKFLRAKKVLGTLQPSQKSIK